MAFSDLMSACDASVRSHLMAGERVLAIGRAEDVTVTDGPGSGPGWTFVMITDQTLRWVMSLDLKLEATLSFDSVTKATEQIVDTHRYTIDLEHCPITRLHPVLTLRPLAREWDVSFEQLTLVHTTLGFSRRGTDAASALRQMLAARGLLDP